MNANAYKIISTNNQRENVTVNAETYNYYQGIRPEIIIPLAHSELPPKPRDVEIFELGQKVRIRRTPHAGTEGTLIDLPKETKTLENGLRVLTAGIRLKGGEEVIVPLVNLEVLG